MQPGAHIGPATEQDFTAHPLGDTRGFGHTSSDHFLAPEGAPELGLARKQDPSQAFLCEVLVSLCGGFQMNPCLRKVERRLLGLYPGEVHWPGPRKL